MGEEVFMNEALEEAKKAFNKNEVPVGAVIVYQEKIIARAHNQVESANDATAHAEIQAIKHAEKILNNWRLNECILYTSLEPCVMCYGASILSRVKKIVYGAPDLRHGAVGGCYHMHETRHPIHQPELVGGVLEKESQKLLKDFFKKIREEKNGA